MEACKKSRADWFMFTGGNDVANERHAETTEGVPELQCVALRCADGVVRPLWPLFDRESVVHLDEWSRRKRLSLRFFLRSGPREPIYEFDVASGKCVKRRKSAIKSLMKYLPRGVKRGSELLGVDVRPVPI